MTDQNPQPPRRRKKKPKHLGHGATISNHSPSGSSGDVAGSPSGGSGRDLESIRHGATEVAPGRQPAALQSLEPGTMVKDRYKIIRQLGVGGMGAVYLAEDQDLSDQVALKVMSPGISQDEKARKRFVQEVKLTRTLTHSGIIRIHDLGKYGGNLFMTMEYVDGRDLRAWITERKDSGDRFEWSWVQSLAKQVCSALSYAHGKGIVHRDLKPENLLIAGSDEQPHIKIADFGIARVLEDDMDVRTRMSTLGAGAGTAYYMAPEQLEGGKIDHRADIYALGVILYELLTGKIAQGRIREISTYRDDVPELAGDAIMSCLDIEAADRPADCQTLIKMLTEKAATESEPLPHETSRPASDAPSLDRETILRDSCRLAISDGQVTKEERAGLKSQAKQLGLDDATLKRIFDQEKLSYLADRPKPAGPKVGDTITNSLGMTLAWIPPGTFQMGSNDGDSDEKPVHEVELTKGFYMGVHVVTQGQWKSLMGTEPWKGESCVKENANCPAVYVSWDDAQKFIAKLNALEGDKGIEYRLPTEAQWEYACRAGSRTAYCFGDHSDDLGGYAWYDKNADDVGEKYAHRVGQKKPNAFGLYDMHGNVYEWCEDRYGDYPSGKQIDPQGPSGGRDRVNRGGCWSYYAGHCRSAHRLRDTTGFRYNNLGFRLVTVRR